MLGHPPYGYVKDGTRQATVDGKLQAVARVIVHPTEKVAVMMMLFDLYIEGWSFPQIAAEFDDLELPTRSGKPWSADTLRDMLRNPIYSGYVLYRGTEDRNRRDAGTLSWTAPGHRFLADFQAQDVRMQRHPHKPKPAWACPWVILT